MPYSTRLGVICSIFGGVTAALGPLPSLNIAGKISISGISSGADSEYNARVRFIIFS